MTEQNGSSATIAEERGIADGEFSELTPEAAEAWLLRGVLEYPSLANDVAVILNSHAFMSYPYGCVLNEARLHQAAGEGALLAFRNRYLALIQKPPDSLEFWFEQEIASMFSGVAPPSRAGDVLMLALSVRIGDLDSMMSLISHKVVHEPITIGQDYTHIELNGLATAYHEMVDSAYLAWRVAMMPFYSDYLASKWWQSKRSQAHDRAQRRCQVCNSDTRYIDVHHRTYERLGREQDSDLTVLCRECHSLFHASRQS